MNTSVQQDFTEVIKLCRENDELQKKLKDDLKIYVDKNGPLAYTIVYLYCMKNQIDTYTMNSVLKMIETIIHDKMFELIRDNWEEPRALTYNMYYGIASLPPIKVDVTL